MILEIIAVAAVISETFFIFVSAIIIGNGSYYLNLTERTHMKSRFLSPLIVVM